MSTHALEGLTVIGFTWLTTGPTLTKFLADHGATVIKIETGTHPDLLRLSPPYKDGKPGVNRSGYFNFGNNNEYSISLNLTTPEGIDIAKRLVAKSGIVVENFRAGVLKRLGLGYDDLKKLHPKLIMLSITMVGQEGKNVQQPGIGVQLVSYAGFTNITGWPDRRPTQPYGAYTDIPGPALGAASLMGALMYRERTGRGLYVDVSQYETGLWFLEPLLLDCTVNGREGSRKGNACDYACPHAVYPCAGDDRWVAIAVFTDGEWDAFCKVIGSPKWTKKPEFRTLLTRKQNEERLNELIGEWTATRTAEEVMGMMQAAGVDAGIAENGKDSLEDPQLAARNHYWKMEHAETGDLSILGQSFILSETPAAPRLPSPILGEHTEMICREYLGMGGEEFVDLMAKGVFE